MRPLPAKHNPMIQPDVSPSYEELLARRRLGSTNLTVRADHVGTSNATRPENLGIFEYAHLRAPLPKNLKGSEIFPLSPTNQHPDTYFLMRRSKDGYVSATGMFKIAFPWAKLADEKSEREYLRGLPETSPDEVAGNLWISPELALELAEEYRMSHWVRALLDPADMPQSSSKSPSKPEHIINPPPKFDISKIDSSSFAPPPSARTRTLRSASPSKSSAAKKATPRKRQTRAQKDLGTPSAAAVSESLQSTLDAVASVAHTEAVGDGENAEEAQEEPVKVNGEQEVGDSEGETIPVKKSTDHVKVSVESETIVDTTEDLETSRTNVTVEVPDGLPELPMPNDTEEMIAKAKEMVEEAVRLQEGQEGTGNPSPKASRKRKVEATIEEGEEDTENIPTQPAKKARLLEERLRRERVRNRALIGVTATLAIAATIPYFF
ncbi:hypothetical protein D8B26_007544 [Coccidioides posadasii str. Silveira]|uniref:Cell pattern formation-associated protein stuA n=2 Tax=Coccidioides posadasii TaxID=199306 RepID=E9D290_COCPS|nr:APSES domain containing protein [Coccidioides posadasii C735 delta SOWgp]EER24963.1 APSES domain containing protein [Coccidioides posadasii C735 delta SOWgp]EFW19304.1 conserved hypothetical protein [Coccidioides posadasii str. Silveira]QVM12927.1 hypothetical protein D8B26_007544 [Coccidioides posadasii str. Silveira]|eukprot:XP_003067108.1 APSES domain containing protein [Coccidioides posadasii C735 delta SOWgp]